MSWEPLLGENFTFCCVPGVPVNIRRLHDSSPPYATELTGPEICNPELASSRPGSLSLPPPSSTTIVEASVSTVLPYTSRTRADSVKLTYCPLAIGGKSDAVENAIWSAGPPI
jgi:hypothetical protein